ncbi:MAG: universal stress protein, partial [Lapillicoccus sp.]
GQVVLSLTEEDRRVSIVVGYIPTREGRAALRRAAVECELRRVPLLVINSQANGKLYDELDTTRFESSLDEVRARLADAGVTVEVRQLVRGKEPAEDLIEVADSSHAELIVIGLRRRTPVGKLILGSNAQRILLDATCPVLAVKASPEDD